MTLKSIEKTRIKAQAVIKPCISSEFVLSAESTSGAVIAARNGKRARTKPPRAASAKPGPFGVRSLRRAVINKPQPVALSTAMGVSEFGGWILKRDTTAKKAATSATHPTAIQSKRFLVSLLTCAENRP